MLVFIIEAILLCVLFTVSILSQIKRPLGTILYSYPPNIVDRVIELGLVVDWYNAFILDIGWFCHSKKVIIPGTEDLTADYNQATSI